MKKLLNKTKKGFTIVELVIVIGVIAILSAILIPTFVNLNDKASKAALQSDLSATYAVYTADAADGMYGDPETSETKINLYEQKYIVILDKDSNCYERDNEGVWQKQDSAPTMYTVFGAGSAAAVVTGDGANGYVVGNYKLFHLAIA